MSEMLTAEKYERFEKLTEKHPFLTKMIDVWLEYQSIFDLSHPESRGETEYRFVKLENDIEAIEKGLKQDNECPLCHGTGQILVECSEEGMKYLSCSCQLEKETK